MAGNETFSKNFLLGVMFVLVVLAFLIIRPLVIALISAGILAYMCYPIQRRLAPKIGKHVSAWIIIIMLILLLIVPSYFVINSVANEGRVLFLTAKQKLNSDTLVETDCAVHPSTFCGFTNKIIRFVQDPQIKFYLEDLISKISNYVADTGYNFVLNLPSIAIDVVVMFFVIYYLLLDGARFIEKARHSIPLKKHHIDHILGEFNNFTYATLYGHFITSLIQGLLGGLTFFILGLSTPIIAGFAMAFFAFLPFIGTPIIWLPAAITLLITGETTKGIVLLLLGTFVISTIDNILRPEIIGNRVKLHPAAVLVGIMGGLYLLGPIGLIAGPLIFSLLLSFMEVYYKEGLGFSHN